MINIKQTLKHILLKRELLVFTILVILILLCGLFNRDFISPSNLIGILSGSLIIIMLSIGESFVIITNGIDVSIGAIMGLCAVSMGMVSEFNVGMSYSIAIMVGITAGMINGFGVSILGIPPIVMTLGTMGIFRGLMPLITGGGWIDSVPQTIKSIAQYKIMSINLFIWFAIIIVVILMIILKYNNKARLFYVVGGNKEGAFNLGIPIRLIIFLSYTICGLFASFAGIIFVSQLSFVPMNAGNGEEMRAIAASILGGISLSGGVGSPLSAFIGAIFLTTVNSMLVFLKVPSYYNDAIAGAILILIVLSDYKIRKYIESMRFKSNFASFYKNNNRNGEKNV